MQNGFHWRHDVSSWNLIVPCSINQRTFDAAFFEMKAVKEQNQVVEVDAGDWLVGIEPSTVDDLLCRGHQVLGFCFVQ